MYRREEFREWFEASGRAPNTVSTHISRLNGVDHAFDLDAKLKALGTDGFLAWAKDEATGPFEKYPSGTRSALNRYIEFNIQLDSPEEPEKTDDEATDQPLLFKLEREMQAAVRRQLNELEPGLVEADGGRERSVATGNVDIVARDSSGGLVVVELKAGLCPATALEQVLGYADALAEEENEPVRAFLVAGDFSDRTRAASRRTQDLKLCKYEFRLQFHDLSS